MLLILTIAALACNFLNWRYLPGSRFHYPLVPDKVGNFFQGWEDITMAVASLATIHMAACLYFGVPTLDFIMDLNAACMLPHIIGRCGYCIFRRESAGIENKSKSPVETEDLVRTFEMR